MYYLQYNDVYEGEIGNLFFLSEQKCIERMCKLLAMTTPYEYMLEKLEQMDDTDKYVDLTKKQIMDLIAKMNNGTMSENEFYDLRYDVMHDQERNCCIEMHTISFEDCPTTPAVISAMARKAQQLAIMV